MNLSTQCPQCGTTFLADLDQLQLRKGYVRCVNCAHIFDGYEAVVPPSGTPASPSTGVMPPMPAMPPVPTVPTVVRQRPAQASAVASAAMPQGHGAPAHLIPDDALTRAPPDDRVFTLAAGVDHGRDTEHSEPTFRVGNASAVRSGPDFAVSRMAPLEGDIPGPVVHRRVAEDREPAAPVYMEAKRNDRSDSRRRPSHTQGLGRHSVGLFLWRMAILVGVALLLAQTVYVYRAQIANRIPALRPALERGCGPLNCEVSYARRIDLISIVGASLSAQSATGGQPSDTMILQLTLRNAHNKPQEWPTLELDLNDFSGTLQVRKNISPDAYLTIAEQEQPFGASSEKVLRLPIALQGLKINGFQVRKFFP